MGQRFATPAGSSTPSAVALRRVHFRARCDEITPELLERVAQARVNRTLGSVRIECKGVFDAELMDALEKAAGVHKLVLHC